MVPNYGQVKIALILFCQLKKVYFLNKIRFAKHIKVRMIARLVGCRPVRQQLDVGLLEGER